LNVYEPSTVTLLSAN